MSAGTVTLMAVWYSLCQNFKFICPQVHFLERSSYKLCKLLKVITEFFIYLLRCKPKEYLACSTRGILSKQGIPNYMWLDCHWFWRWSFWNNSYYFFYIFITEFFKRIKQVTRGAFLINKTHFSMRLKLSTLILILKTENMVQWYYVCTIH